MYFLTSMMCGMAESGIEVKSEAALEDVELVLKLLFTPINSMVLLASMGNTFGKLKDKMIEQDKAVKRTIIVLVVFIVLLIIESNYMGGFVQNLLG